MTDKLRAESGAPVADNQNSQTAGPRGPVLAQDQHLLEKLARSRRSRARREHPTRCAIRAASH